jgi:hypothetical protein
MLTHPNSHRCFKTTIQAFLMFVWVLSGLQAVAKPPAAPNGPLDASAPTWSVNPGDFEFNMNMVIRVNYNGSPDNGANNIVGAFNGNQLRGVSTPVISGGFAYYFITIYSNSFVGDRIDFRFYHAPNDKIYSAIEHVVFRHHLSIGTTDTPFWINIDPNFDFPPELLPIPWDTTLVGMPIPPLTLANYLVSMDGDPVTWSAQPGPNLTVSLVNGILTVTPASPVWTGTDSVRVIVTENTPNHKADTTYARFTILPDYGPPVWKPIPNQTVFLKQPFNDFNLNNYLIFAGDCHQFGYDVFPFTGTIPNPNWAPPAPGQQPMTVVVRPLFANLQLAGAGAKLAAFVGGNLAGVASPTGTAPNVTYQLALQNVGAGPITFRFYHATNQYLYEKISTLPFTAGGTAGTVSAPILLQLAPLVPSLSNTGQVQIGIVDSAWVGNFPINFIVWDCHFPTTRRDTQQAVYSVVADKRPKITSSTTTSFEENACTVLYDTQSTDPNNAEGAGLTYSLAGGADAAKFAVNPQTGILSWAAGFSPDFEIPADADMNNQYLVKIRVTNLLNLSDTILLTVTITNQAVEPFKAAINGGGSLICINSTVNLQASGGVGYIWNTGVQQASIANAGSGTYTVTVTSTGGCTATASVVVSPAPSLTATGSTPVCTGSSIQLHATPGGGTMPYGAYAWAGPNNYAASGKDPAPFNAAPAAAGVYTVTVTDAANCSATATTTVSVSGSTAPKVVASVNTPVCEGSNIVLSGVASGGSGAGYNLVWAGPNNYHGSTQNPTPFPAVAASAGVYTVTLTDNAGCSVIATTTLAVNPVPSVTAANNGPISVGANLLLTSSASGGSGTGYTYQWAGPNNFSANGQNPPGVPVGLAANGVYTVTVTDSHGCTGTSTTTLEVFTCPFIIPSTAGPTCENGTITLQSTPSGGALPYASIVWTGPNNYMATGQNPPPFPASPSAAGYYTVIITDKLGCKTNISFGVTLNPNPTITATNNGPLCEGSNIVLTSSPAGGSGVFNSFAWTGPDNFTGATQNPSSFTGTVASTGVYQVKVTDSKGCTGTATTSLNVKPNPIISASANSPICLNANLDLITTTTSGSGVYSQYAWTGPNNFNSTLANPTPFPAVLNSTGIYRVTVTDNAGCSSSASATASVSSNIAPTISISTNSPVCAGNNLIITSTPGSGSGTYNGYAWTGPNGFSSTLKNPNPFQAFTNATGVYTVTVTDSHNCKGTSSASVTINGPTATASSNSPVCPGGTVLLTGGPTVGGYTYSWTGPNNFTSGQQNPPGFPAVPGDYILTVRDLAGCIAMSTTTVVTADAVPPSITCPGPQTVNADQNCSAAIGAYGPVAISDNCTLNPTYSQNPLPTALIHGANSTQTVTLTADDGNGNTKGCTFIVTLKDNIKPTITCPGPQIVAADANCKGVIGSYTAASVADNCTANPVVTQSPINTTPLSGHDDVKTVTLTADDGNGNTQSCTFTVTLKDQTPPTITCPADQTIAANATCDGVVGAYSPTLLKDNCTANPVFIQSPAPSTTLHGHNDFKTITLTANDGHGNFSNCTLKVTLKDVTQPFIICPVDQIVFADGNCAGQIGAYPAVIVSDNCTANPAVSQSPVSTTLLHGHNDFKTVTLTADDGNGNTKSCSFKVTLKDVTPPTIVCPVSRTVNADDNCNGVIGAHSPVSVSDNCTPNPVVTQSPAPSTTLHGHNDFKTVTLTADDGNGNTAACSFTVTLKDITPPVVVCPGTQTVSADPNCSGVVGLYPVVSVTDNCTANPAVVQSPGPQTPLNGVGDSKTVTMTAFDGNGNSATCSFTVILKDLTAPFITCPGPQTVYATASGCSAPVGAYAPVSMSDYCNANPTYTQSPVASTLITGHNKTKIVTLTADDGYGNTKSCTILVTLKDTISPTLVCPGPQILNADANCTGAIPLYTPVSVSDNCTANPPVAQGPPPGCLLSGHNDTKIVTLSATDGNGNTKTCSFSVTLKDVTPPTITCPANQTINAGANCSAALGTYAPVSASDNCTSNLTIVQSPLPTTTLSGNNDSKTVTLTATDQNNNSKSCSFTVTLKDVTPPAIVCPGSQTINANPTCDGVVGAYTPVSVSDNCASSPIVTQSPVSTTALHGNNDSKTVTLTATDGNGNTQSCSFTVTLKDVTPPTITCPANQTITANGNCIGLIGTYAPASVADNCSANPSITQSPVPTTILSGNNDSKTVTLTANDGNGNTATCTFTVTLKDQTPPTITCPANQTVNATSGCNGAIGSYTPTYVSDNCNANPTVTQSPVSGTSFTDTKTVTLTANDGNGNTQNCSFTVTVNDLTPPTITCPANQTVNAGANCSGVVGSYSPVSVSDNCTANPTVTQSPAPSTTLTGQNNAKTVTLTANDSNGNAASCSFTVTLKDVTPPSITCPVDQTVNAGTACTGVVGSYAAVSVSDNCAASPTVTQSPAPATTLTGHNDAKTVTLTANDGNGNTKSCSFTVTLKDVTPPSITCPANQTVNAGANCSGVIGSYAAASVSDNCATNPAVTQSPLATTPLNGNNDSKTVTLTANDGNGNTKSCSFTVTLKDVTPPAITCPANQTVNAGPNCTAAIGSFTAASVSDNCAATPTVTQSPAPATSLTGSNDSKTVTLTANDGNGNTATCSFTVTLKDVTPPTITCPANQTINANTSCSGLVGSYAAVSVSDNCTNNPAVTQSPVATTTLSGQNDSKTVTLTATDGSGNTGTCTFTVTLKDVTPPTITCPANQTVNAGANCSGVIGTYTAASVSDNCTATPAVTQSPAASTTLSGQNDSKTVTLTANDGNGNTANCTFTVTLKDVTPPSITCPANQTVNANASCGGVIGTYAAASVSDNCASAPTVTQSPVASTTLSGQNDSKTVTLTANDGNGNTASCSFTVTLKDVTPPTITCPANQTVNTTTSCTGVVGTYSAASVSDNCASTPAVTQSPAAGTTLNGNNDSKTVTLTANDGNGNSATCTFTVSLKDVTPPTITCPANQTVNANASCGGVIGAYSAVSVSDNCTTTPTVTQSPVATTALSGANDSKTVTLTANDGNGNTGTCSFTVTLKDVTPPTITCPANQTVNANASCSGVIGTYSAASVADNCTASPAVTQSPVATTALNGNNDSKTVTLTATDGSGNTANCSFTVTLKDVTPPTIVCPGAQTVNAGASCTGVVGSYIPASLTDNCASMPAFTQSPVSTTALSGNNDSKTVTLTANDGNGNTASCSFTVTLKDVTPPTITCPGNQTVNANASCSGLLGSYSAVSLSDNCASSPTVTQSPSSSTALSGNNNAKTVTLTANDGNGNTASCSFTVTLKDVTPPTITCPANQTVNANASCGGVIGSYGAVSLSDNCATSPTVTQSPSSSTALSGNGDSKTVTLTANDGNGNSASCSFSVTLKDVTPPSITCPANQIISANASCGGVVGSFTPASISDNCTANPAVTQSPAPATTLTGHNDSKTVTLTANDGNGNTASCSFTVTLKDLTAPAIMCPVNQIVSASANCSGTLGTYSPLSVSDNCNAAPVVTQSPVATTALSGNGDSKTVTLTANDGNGNTTSCSFTVTLKDVTPPSITCPANQTINASSSCGGLVGAYTPVSVSDNCAASPAVTQLPAPTTALSGSNDSKTVTLTANDGNGNTSSCSFTVTLKDITPPTIACPANQTVNANASCGGVVGTYSPVFLADNCAASPAVTQSPAPATTLSGNNDSKTVTLTANDGNGNTSTCTFTVTLKDLTAPTIVCKPYTAVLSANGTAVITTSNVFQSGFDNCGAVVQQSVVPSTFTCSNLGNNNVVLTVNDGNGNTATCTAVVTVIDNLQPIMACKPASLVLNASGQATLTVAQVNNNSIDNCTLASLSLSASTFTCANLGSNSVVLTGIDQSNNSASCTSTVTISDNIAPTMICANVGVNLNASGQATLTAANVNNGSFDNCTIASLVLSQTVFTCSNVGANTVTLTGTDQSGNTGQCTATVTVSDPIPPVAKCKNVTANLGANGSITVAPSTVNNGSTDNCTFTLTLTPGTFTCANVGINIVTLKATDVGGNTSTCTAQVTVKDVMPPSVQCNNPTIFLNAAGQVTLTVAQAELSSSDNCGIVSHTLSFTQFSCGDIGAPKFVTLTVTDAAGNSSTCQSTVTIKDNTPPTAICTNTTVHLSSSGTATVYGATLAANSTDNCSVGTYSPVAKVYTAANLGNNNLVITVKDWSNNASTCTSVVTVLPPQSPPSYKGTTSGNGQTGYTGGDASDLHFALYPNPTTGLVTLAFHLENDQDMALNIFNNEGRLVESKRLSGVAGDNLLGLDLAAQGTGVYWITVRAGQMSAQKRVLVVKN